MSKRGIYIGIALLFLLGAILIYFIQGRSTPGKLGHQSSDWYTRYGFDSKDPYGLYYFNTLLQQRVASKKIQHVSNERMLDTLLNQTSKTLYVLIGDTVTLEPKQFQHIIANVKEGDGLMLFANKTYQWVYDSLALKGNLSYAYANEIALTTREKTYTLHHIYQADTIYGRTFGLQACNKPPLCSTEDLLVETAFPLESGEVLVGFFPKAIVNYQLLSPAGLAHAEMLTSQLRTYDRVLFLSYANLKWQSHYAWEETSPEEERSLLKLINEHPPLKHAVYGLLLGLFLLVLFAGKRKQAITPLPEAPSRLTSNYIQTLASIYQSHESPLVAFNLVKQQFFHAIQRSFYVDISKYSLEDQVRTLKEKTSIEEYLVQETLRLLHVSSDQVGMPHVYLTANRTHLFLEQAGILRVRTNPKQFPFMLGRKSVISFFYVFVGFVFIFIGGYSLAQSNALGPGLAVIGALLFGLGILRFRRPVLRVFSHESAAFYPLIGAPIRCKIGYNEQERRLAMVPQNGERKLILPTWDYDKNSYTALITLIKQKSHGRTTSNG